MLFNLRPDLTWRARASLVDDNRVAISLSRNNRQAASVIFSRRDLGLPALEDTTSARRAKAQLLTGAAVFILVELSRRHPELRDGLCGAREWRSVALQVIATSTSLLEPPEDKTHKIQLLARSVNEDPDNVLARLEHIWAVQQSIDLDDPQYQRFTQDLDRELSNMPPKWTLLRLRGRHHSAAQWINLHVRSRLDPEATPLQSWYRLYRAKVSVRCFRDELEEACRKLRTREGTSELRLLVAQSKPIAASFEACLKELSDRRSRIDRSKEPTPLLAYEFACLDTIKRLVTKQPQSARSKALHDLRLALPTADDKEEAWNDPCLSPLREVSAFQELTGHTLPANILDLPAFDSCRNNLKEAAWATQASSFA
ncbi:hypothetical protein ACFQ1I_46550 [Kitasatospora arboriphila]